MIIGHWVIQYNHSNTMNLDFLVLSSKHKHSQHETILDSCHIQSLNPQVIDRHKTLQSSIFYLWLKGLGHGSFSEMETLQAFDFPVH